MGAMIQKAGFWANWALDRLFRTVGFLDSWAPDNRAQLVCRYNIYNISINIFKNVLSDIDIFKNGGIIWKFSQLADHIQYSYSTLIQSGEHCSSWLTRGREQKPDLVTLPLSLRLEKFFNISRPVLVSHSKLNWKWIKATTLIKVVDISHFLFEYGSGD